jgi:hypothetical protein
MVRLKILLIFIAALIPFGRLYAQTILTPFTEITGSVGDSGSQTYTFTAQSGAVVSLIARAVTPDFDPILTLSDQAGRVLFSSDDYAYPDSRDALLEAVTLPQTSTYTVTVSGYDASTGDYALTLLPGFGAPVSIEEFNAEGWRATGGARALRMSSTLSMTATGAHTLGVAFNPDVIAPPDFMAQVDVMDVHNPSGWTVGLAVRRSGSSYYLFEINAEGLWRFSRSDGGTLTTIRNWIPHPSIVAGEASFTLGVMANGVGFDFFYNTAYIGSANDDQLGGAGAVGLTVGTTSSLSSETSAQFDNLIITEPVEVGGGRVIPQQLPVGEGTALVLALKRQHMIAPNGVMALTLPESSVQYARPGVNRLMLGRGATYTNFALGVTVDITGGVSTAAAGCGLVFRYADETHYTLAFVDQTGGYGISQREGENFLPGLFGEQAAVRGGRHHLLIIADGDTLHYYVDRQFVGSMDNPPQNGQIGTAVVNFEGVNTSCGYSNLWLWEWD